MTTASENSRFSRRIQVKFLEPYYPNIFGYSYAVRGDAYRRKGDPDQAINDCTKCIEINPPDQPVLELVFQKQCAVRSPIKAYAYAIRADAYRQKGDEARAAADLSRAKELKWTP